MTVMRAYFYDERGVELKDHPANGRTWVASGGWVRDKNGLFKSGYRSSVTVANYADLWRIDGEKTLTIADFPGCERVGLKVWHPDPLLVDRSWLVAEDRFSAMVPA